MPRLESIICFIIFASMLLSLIPPRLVFANAPESLHFQVKKPAITAEIQVPIPSLEVQTFSSSCDNFTSSLDGWTTVSSSNTATVTNPPGMMRLSSSQSPPSGQYAAITVKKILAGHPGSITVTSVFTTFSGTTVQLWVEYADGSTDYIYSYGTTPSVPTTHVANFTTNPGKTAVALYFYAAASWLFPPWRVDIDQICVTALSSGQTIYLPLIMRDHTPPATFPVFIGTAIPIRPIAYQGEIFYRQTVQIPDQLPLGGHFYFSTQPGVVTQVLVDDELAVLLNGAELFTYDFSSSGSPKSAIVEMPRATLEQLAGRTMTIQYRDVYGVVVYATQMWLIWTP